MTGLVLSVYLSLDAFLDWRENMIITRFENSEFPVTELDFPAVTVCSQGLNMDNVAKAVERDFYEWHRKREKEEGEGRRSRREARAESLSSLMSVYLLEKFDISEDDPGTDVRQVNFMIFIIQNFLSQTRFLFSMYQCPTVRPSRNNPVDNFCWWRRCCQRRGRH